MEEWKIDKSIFYITKLLIAFFLTRYFCNELITNSKEYNKDKPKISVFLPIYNKEKYLKRSIGSIQRQTLKEIEIIPINDCSTDNSLNILKKMAEKDQRILIINNEKNSGSLYSRGMGILKSKGEYLMSLDPDDSFRGSNSLKYLYDKAKELNVDIISYYIIYMPGKFKSDNYSSFNEIVKQPKLFHNAFDRKGLLNDFYITNKLVKKEIFKKAFKLFKKYIYGKKWNYYEDNIWSILTYKYSKSAIFINKIIYIYYQNNDSVMKNRGNILELENLLFRHEMYKEIFKSKSEQKYLIAGCSQLLDIFENNTELIYNNSRVKSNFIIKMKEFIKDYKIPKELIKKLNLFINKIS